VAKSNPRTEAPDDPDDELEPEVEDRNEELSENEDVHEALLDLYKDIERGWENQEDRTNSMMDYWDIYNCKLGSKQYYSGNSQIFLPIVHDAVKARKTRFSNQIFPQAGRYVEVTSEDGTLPQAEMSLAEHYIRRCKLRTAVVPALCVNGDVEGQYNVYVSWVNRKRHVVWRKPQMLSFGRSMGVGPDPSTGAQEPVDIAKETLSEGRPHVEVLADSDVLLLPATAETVDEAIAHGGSATIMRRWSKAKIKQMIKDEEITKDAGKQLLDAMMAEKSATRTDKGKVVADAAGIKTTGDLKYALVYETWTELTIPSVDGDDERRICRVFFGSEKIVLSCKRNPNWSDKVPLLSVPVEKVQGSAKGKSQVQPCEQTQYYANDIINEAADSSMYSMMPIVMTDPNRNPRIGSMVLSLAAVWETDPQSTQFAKFPDIWKSGFEIVASCKAQIMQTLSVSPAAITQSSSQKSKPSQADVAREQQVDILTTADAVTVIEEGILTPMVQMFIELDHQHRKDKLLVRQFGEMGLKAKMDWIPPIQMEKKYAYRWFGVEQARNQMQLQQQISGIGMVTKLPPQMYQGYKLNLVPVIINMMEGLFGPRLAPLVFVDEAKQMTLEPQLENEWLAEGIELAIHPKDQDQEHLKAHVEMMQQNGGNDPTGNIQRHIERHMAQMQMKKMLALQQAMQQMMGGGQQQGGSQLPGGRAGAQVRGPRGNGQGPPGMIHRDQIGPAAGQPPALRQRG